MHISIALAMSLMAGVAAHAQGVEPIRDALTNMPGHLLNKPSAVQFSFVDIAALRALGSGDIDPTLAERAIIGDALPHFVALRARGGSYWAERSLIALANTRYLAASSLQPVIWGLDSEDTATATIAALDALDFDAIGSEGVLSNVGASHPVDAESLDPWRYAGRDTSYIAAKGNVIIQAIAPRLVEATLRDEPDMGDSDVVNAALGGIEAALGDGTLVQAMLITPLMGLGGTDREMLLNGRPTLEEMREKLEAELQPGTEGIPSYLGGFIADAQGEQPSVMISLAYPDCAIAERAAAHMADRWANIKRDDVRGDLEYEVIQASSGLCAATLNVTDASTDDLSNPTFDAFIRFRHHFEVLQIGRSE